MSQEFISDKNKAFIWQLLLDNNAFDNISEVQYGSVKGVFDSVLNLGVVEFMSSVIKFNLYELFSSIFRKK